MHPDNWQVWQDEAVARAFTTTRRACIPGVKEQFTTLLRLVANVQASPLRILDLGCGDGIVLDTLLTVYPDAQAVALDGSLVMLQQAGERFATRDSAYPPVMLFQADFNTPAWLKTLHTDYRQFDVIVSAFAIHHSEDDRKRALYEEIYDLLAPGGVFVNIEHVASASPLGERLFEEMYAENMTATRQRRGESVTVEQVYAEFTIREDKAANRLTLVETQTQWLREIGFVDVDCYWKWVELAVFGGFKRR